MHVQCGEAAKHVEPPALDDAPGAQHRDAIADRLDLAQDVRREQHRLPAVVGFADAGAEHLLHQRIETGGRLVEQQEVGPTGERGDEEHLLLVAVAVRADLLVGIELEAFDQLVAVGAVDRAVHVAKELEHSAPVSEGQRSASLGTYASRRCRSARRARRRARRSARCPTSDG